MNAAVNAVQIDDLESVINTEELTRRPSRAPDYAAESRILESLAQGMADAPELVLQDLAQAALKACQAGSAGISLIEEDGDHVRWHALLASWPRICGARHLVH